MTGVDSLRATVARLTTALERIVDQDSGGRGCSTYTGPPWCRDEGSGRRLDGVYGVESWCDSCIARAALDATTAPEPTRASRWTPETLPPTVVKVVDVAAGKIHSDTGPVRAAVAEVLNTYDSLTAPEPARAPLWTTKTLELTTRSKVKSMITHRVFDLPPGTEVQVFATGQDQP